MKFAAQIFPQVFESSLLSGGIVILLFLFRPLLRKQFGSGLVSLMWAVVLIRLVTLWPLESGWSALNIWPRQRVESTLTSANWKVKASLSDAPLESSAVVKAEQARSVFVTEEVIPFLSIGWGLGVVAMMLNLVVRLRRTVQFARRTEAITDARLLKIYEGIPARLKRGVSLRVSPDICVAALVGILRPQIWVPRAWSRDFNDEELRHVFLHELGHVRRGDLVGQWCFALLRCIHWFNPLVWIAARLSRSDAEMACDAWVLAQEPEGGRESYGDTLVKVARLFRHSARVEPVTIGMAASRHALFYRIQAAVDFIPVPRWRRWLGGILGAVAAVTLITDRVAAEAQVPPVPEAPVEESKPTGGTPAPDPVATGGRPQIEIESRFFKIQESDARAIGLIPTAASDDAKKEIPPLSVPSILEAEKVGEIFRKMDAIKDVDLLSAPRVTTLSGQKAKVEIVREFVFPSEFEHDDKVTGGLVPTSFEKRDIGVTLEVTPTVTADGSIELAMTPTVTELEGFMPIKGGEPIPMVKSSGDTLDPTGKNIQYHIPKDTLVQPIFSMRTIRTSVSLRSGQSILLGGLKSQNDANDRMLYILVSTRLLGDGTAGGVTHSKETADPTSALKPDQLVMPVNVGIPVAIAREGDKPGYVHSPFAPDKGLVDVRGFRSGTEVKCPYTGNVFRLP